MVVAVVVGVRVGWEKREVAGGVDMGNEMVVFVVFLVLLLEVLVWLLVVVFYWMAVVVRVVDNVTKVLPLAVKNGGGGGRGGGFCLFY